MAARSIWSGAIQLHPLMQVPVKAYKATDGYDGLEPLKQVCECHGKPMLRTETCVGGKLRLTQDAIKAGHTAATHAQVVKAVQVTDDDFRVVPDGQLAQVTEAFASKVITVDRILPYDATPLEWVDETFFLKVDVDEQAATLAAALDGRVIIGRWLKGGHENIVAIQAVGNTLLMSRVRFAQELRDDSPFTFDQSQINDQAVDLTRQLLAQFEAEEFDHSAYEDGAVAKRAEIIDAVKKGAPIPAAVDDDDAPAPTDLVAALQATLAATSKGKAAAKAATKGGKKQGGRAKAGRR